MVKKNRHESHGTSSLFPRYRPGVQDQGRRLDRFAYTAAVAAFADAGDCERAEAWGGNVLSVDMLAMENDWKKNLVDDVDGLELGWDWLGT